MRVCDEWKNEEAMSSKFSSSELLESLLNQEPQQIQVWLARAFSGEIQIPPEFNWLGLAQSTASIAMEKLEAKISPLDMEWAKVAVAIYEFLIAESNNSSIKHSLEDSCMKIRVNMIRVHGHIKCDSILDSQKILDWFLSNLKISLEEASNIIILWKDFRKDFTLGNSEFFKESQFMETIRELYHTKSRLSAIQSLVELQILLPDEQLKSWLELKERLP